MSSTLYRDAITLALIAFLFMVVLMFPYLNPPADTEQTIAPGNIAAIISWPEGNADVDLWVHGPGEPWAVGYSNKGGVLWDLLRDDLGTQPDYLPFNFENAYTRGVPPGDYRINVHCYRCKTLPVEVTLEVSKNNLGGSREVIATSTIVLRKDHEEKTGLAFHVDVDGNVERDSLTTLFAPLRSGRK